MELIDCSYCGNQVEDTDHSDKPELHEYDCPIREIMELRVSDDEVEKQETSEELNRRVASLIDDIPTECPFCDEIIEYRGGSLLYCEHCDSTWDVEITLI